MTFHLPLQLLSLFTFTLLSLSLSSAFPLSPLISLKCSPPSTNRTLNHTKNPVKSLIGNLTAAVVKTQFATSNVSFSLDVYFYGVFQCRVGLGLTECTQCARTAERSILARCKNSDAGSAWYDGCYVGFHFHRGGERDDFYRTGPGGTSFSSCSDAAVGASDRAMFEPALGTLLLRLSAGVVLATHRGFWHGEIVYGNNRTAYAIVECVRSLSPGDCEVCVGEATEKLQEACVGRDGGTVVSGPCLVRFENHRFYTPAGGGGSGPVPGGGGFCIFCSPRDEHGGRSANMGLKVKIAWGVGVAFLLGTVVSGWLLRRSVINKAKVGIESKGVD